MINDTYSTAEVLSDLMHQSVGLRNVSLAFGGNTESSPRHKLNTLNERFARPHDSGSNHAGAYGL